MTSAIYEADTIQLLFTLPQDEDAQLAAAIAASLRDSSPPSAAISQPQAPRPTPAGKGPAPTSVQLPDGSCVVRRVIPSDNSCLFNAVGYVMEHDRHKAAALRKVIADTVAGDPGDDLPCSLLDIKSQTQLDH